MQRTVAPPAWRNRGFVVLSVTNAVLTSNQVLLNVVVPLWLVERTDAPHALLAWLFGTNTVMAVMLQVRASRGSETVDGALRAVRLSGWAFVLSCLVVSVTDETVGWVSIVLIWLGHVTITGAELWQSASDWGFQSELSDHRRLGDYQGVWSLGYQVGPVIFPGLYTFLALQWGAPGWAVIAASPSLLPWPPILRHAAPSVSSNVPATADADLAELADTGVVTDSTRDERDFRFVVGNEPDSSHSS